MGVSAHHFNPVIHRELGSDDHETFGFYSNDAHARPEISSQFPGFTLTYYVYGGIQRRALK